MEKLFECSVSFTYTAETPEEAASQFMANLQTAEWYVHVKNCSTREKFVVDTENYTVENG